MSDLILYFSTRLIRAGVWHAYLPVLLPGRLLQLGGTTCLSGVAAPALRYASQFPRPWGSAENVLLGIDAEGLP